MESYSKQEYNTHNKKLVIIKDEKVCNKFDCGNELALFLATCNSLHAVNQEEGNL